MRGLGLGFTSHVGVEGVLGVCLCFGCGGVGGVGGESVGGLDQGLEGWGGVQVYVYCAWRIPAHLRCTHRYLLPNMYLFIADIANPDSFVCCCRTWISLDITRLYLFREVVSNMLQPAFVDKTW